MRPGAKQKYGMVLATCLSALIVASGPSAQASEERGDAASRYLAEGRALLAKGDLKAAEIQFKNALREAPDDFDSRFQLGQVYLREGAGGAAEGIFNNLWQRNEHPEQVMPKLADAYLMQGKTREVLDRVQAAEGYPPAVKAEIAVARARAYLIQKQNGEAKREAEAALALQPDLPAALIIRAVLLLQSNDFAGAERVVDGLLAQAPQNFEALAMKGDLRRQAGDYGTAVKYFDQAIGQRPANPQARLARAGALLALHQVDQAKQDVDTVLQAQPAQPAGLLLRGYLLANGGKYDEALRILQPVAEQLSGVAAADALFSQLNIRLNHPEQAVDYAQRYLSETSGSPAAVQLLAMAYARKGEPSKVAELLEPVVALHPDNVQAQMLLGDAYAALGRYDSAAKVLSTAAQAKPEDADLRTRLDADRFRAGEQAAALSDLSALVGSDSKETGRAGILLVALQMQEGEFDEAARLADKLEAEQPKNPLPDYLLGVIHQAQGDTSSARKAYRSALAKRADFYPPADALASLDLAEGKSRDAQAEFEQVLVADPKNVKAMQALARLAAARGDGDKAVDWLEKAAATAPKLPDPRLLEIDLLIAQKKATKALALANAVSDSFPDNAAVAQAFGQAQWAAGNQDAAVAAFRRAAALQPNTAAVQYRLGRLLAALGRPSEALAAYEAATRQDPLFLPAWHEIVLAMAAEKGNDQALAAAQGLAARDPALAEELKGDVYFQAKRYPDSDKAYAAAAEHRPSSQLTLHRWEALSRAGNRPAADDVLAAWLKLHPDDAQIRLVYASELMSAKDRSSAIHEYEAVLRHAPTNILALNNLAWLYADAHDPRALELARRAHGLAPLNPRVSDTLAWLLVEQGQLGEGKELLGIAHGQQPGNAEIAYHLAVATERSGEPGKAAELLKPLVGGQPFDHQAEAKALYAKLTTAQ